MKKWIATLSALVLALSVTACGAKNTPPTAVNEAPSAATTIPRQTNPTTPSARPTSPSDDWESQVEAEVTSVLDALTAEYEALTEGIDSYAAYIANQAQIEAFYQKLQETSASLCLRMCSCSLEYAEELLASGKSTDDMYDDMEFIYDLIYDDMGDEIYDGIYDGILDDLYDDFYDGALDDRPDDVEYADWSGTRSKEYKQWSATRSDTYEHWSDMRSDVYGFWSDMRSELWSDDLEDALDELEDFRKDVEKMTGKAADTEILPRETTAQEEMTTPNNSTAAASGIRPEFKELMDSYELFFDEYVTFMKAYMNSDNPLSMISEYTAIMQQYTETMTKLQSINQGELSTEELLYYTEVMLRINQKLTSIA